MRRLWLKFKLWNADYCTVHLIPKRRSFRSSYCEACNAERIYDNRQLLDSAVEELRKLNGD